MKQRGRGDNMNMEKLGKGTCCVHSVGFTKDGARGKRRSWRAA